MPRFEDELRKLEEAVEKLESGDLSLEEALEAFEEGMKAAKACEEILESARTRVRKLVEGEEGFRLEILDEGQGRTGGGS